EVHRYPDQGEIQLRQSGSGPIGGSQEGGDIRKRPFPPVAITELLLGHPAESRVVNIATFGVTVPLAERLQFVRVDHDRILAQRRSAAPSRHTFLQRVSVDKGCWLQCYRD